MRDPIVAHQLAGMILFYESMTRKVLGESAPLAKAILELAEFTNKVFFDILKNQAKSLLKELPFVDAALEPLEQIYSILYQLVCVKLSNLIGRNQF